MPVCSKIGTKIIKPNRNCIFLSGHVPRSQDICSEIRTRLQAAGKTTSIALHDSRLSCCLLRLLRSAVAQVGGARYQRAQLGTRDIERHMLKAALGCEKEPVSGKAFQSGSGSRRDLVDSFNRITSLVDDAHREFSEEIPGIPKRHHVVVQRAMLQDDLVDSNTSKRIYQVVIGRGVRPLPVCVAAAYM